MRSSKLLIYDDGQGQWGPITDLRPVFDLRTGTLTTRQRIEHILGLNSEVLIVPHVLAPLVIEANTQVQVNQSLPAGQWLLVNGRWSTGQYAQEVRSLPLGTILVQKDGQPIAAHLEDAQAQRFVDSRWQISSGINIQHVDGQLLLERPWHILDNLDQTLRMDLNESQLPLCDPGKHDAVCFGEYDVRVANTATLQPKVIFNAEQGPIVVEEGALIGAMSVLEGPCYIGQNSQVSCNGHIRPYTVIGPVCKVAGEISHTIVHSHSNKGHHGYLGHSLVGQWVNLGAATNVSNLKNTYSNVRVQLSYDQQPQDTGRLFHGPLIGDFTRTAIGTRLLTGSCIGTGSMVAHSSYAPKFIERFTFLLDTGAQHTQIDKFLDTAQKMMNRRECRLTEALENRLRVLSQMALHQSPNLFSKTA